MPRETLPVSGSMTFVQNTVYALPARAVTIFSDLQLEISNIVGFTTNSTIAATTPTKVSGLFVRCTTGAALVATRPD
jgi:hypothetical protein